jgi:hypothetical protein
MMYILRYIQTPKSGEIKGFQDSMVVVWVDQNPS